MVFSVGIATEANFEGAAAVRSAAASLPFAPTFEVGVSLVVRGGPQVRAERRARARRPQPKGKCSFTVFYYLFRLGVTLNRRSRSGHRGAI